MHTQFVVTAANERVSSGGSFADKGARFPPDRRHEAASSSTLTARRVN